MKDQEFPFNKFMRLHTDDNTVRVAPETRLWCAILKRAIDDVLHYKPDTLGYVRAVEWLTCPGDEHVPGTLANVLSHILPDFNMQDQIVSRLRTIVFNREKLELFKTACMLTSPTIRMREQVRRRNKTAPSTTFVLRKASNNSPKI